MHNTDDEYQHKSDDLKINRLLIIIKNLFGDFQMSGFNSDKILSNSILSDLKSKIYILLNNLG
jgi:hypothetical protein